MGKFELLNKIGQVEDPQIAEEMAYVEKPFREKKKFRIFKDTKSVEKGEELSLKTGQEIIQEKNNQRQEKIEGLYEQFEAKMQNFELLSYEHPFYYDGEGDKVEDKIFKANIKFNIGDAEIILEIKNRKEYCTDANDIDSYDDAANYRVSVLNIKNKDLEIINDKDLYYYKDILDFDENKYNNESDRLQENIVAYMPLFVKKINRIMEEQRGVEELGLERHKKEQDKRMGEYKESAEYKKEQEKIKQLLKEINSKEVDAPQNGKEQVEFLSVWRTVELGTGLKNVEEFEAALKKAGIEVTDYARKILGMVEEEIKGSPIKERRKVELVNATPIDLGLSKGGTIEQIFKAAKDNGLEVCPAEVGPQAAIQFDDQPNGEYRSIGMSPWRDMNDIWKSRIENWGIFDVKRDIDGRCFLGVHDFYGADDVFGPNHRFVFVRRK